MMNMKKLLALLLAVVMVLGMFPMGALAEETEPELCTCGLVLNHDGECQSQEPAPQNLEEPELCTCGLEKGHEGECKTAEPEYCDCGLTKGHEGECKTAEPEYCDCGLEKGHEGDCQTAEPEKCDCGLEKGHEGECKTAEPEYCDCGLEKGHEGDCQTAEPEYCDCGLTKGHEGDCKKAEPEKCALCESTEHATNQCSLFCGFCQKVPCECVSCDKCGVKNGHTDKCELKPCADCGKNPCECGVFAELNAKVDFDTFYAALLEKVNDELSLEELMALTTEQIIALTEKAESLFAAIAEPTQEDEWDLEDLLATLNLLPNAPNEEIVISELPDLIPGDYDSIMAHLDALYEEVQTLTSYEECDDLFHRLFAVTLAAVESDELLVTTEQMIAINKKYDEIMEYMEKRFGYTDGSPSIALYSGKSSGFTVSKSSDASGSVEYSKSVAKVADNEYLLTLDAFVTGEAATITKTKPADIVLVLDQSASMYAPMGASGGKNNSQIWDAEDFGGNVTQYTKTQFKNLFTQNSSLYQSAAQLGYFVAQSRGGGYRYCKYYNVSNSGHTHGDDCKTYDWFVVKYLPDGDSAGKHWYLYRIKQTANPSRDSQSYSNGEIIHDAAPMKYESFDDMANFYFYKSQFGALYDAISAFGKGIVEANAGHRLAVVGFSAGAEYRKYADGSGIYVNGSYKQYNTKNYYTGVTADWEEKRKELNTLQKFYDADTLTANDYKSALMNADNNMTNIMASINAVQSDSWGTNHDVGMDMANKIFAQNPINHEERDRIILMFTDGAPSPVSIPAYANDYGTTNTAANNQAGMRDVFVKLAYTAKTTHKAQIYTIWTSTLATSSSMFMRYASSDYPNAQNYTNHGSEIASPKYASGVKSGAELLEAFGKVFEDVSNATNTVLKTETIIRDIVAPSFTLPIPAAYAENWDNMTEEEQYTALASQIQVFEAKYKGNDVFAQPGEAGYTEFSSAIIDISKDQNDLYKVDVKNYDFSTNYVADLPNSDPAYRGAKLVIKVPIIVKPDFLGGNSVVTNGKESGIYASDGSAVGIFDVPDVDIPVKQIKPAVQNGAIYLSQAAALSHVGSVGDYKVGTETYTIDGINNAYVNIEYTLVDGEKTYTYYVPAGTTFDQLDSMDPENWKSPDGETADNAFLYRQLLDDTTCKVICKVTPKTTGTVNGTEGEDTGKIYVFKPVVTFQDSCINLGERANYDETGASTTVTQNYVSTTWVNDTVTLAAFASELGAAPNLEFTYLPIEGSFTKDTPVQVTSVISPASNTFQQHQVPADTDILPYTTFYRQKGCEFAGCEMNGAENNLPVVTKDKESWVNFVVHLNTFDIKIEKTGWNALEPGQSYIFNVVGPQGSNINLDVMLNCEDIVDGMMTAVLKGVPVGTYTITEDTNWSWRYTPKGNAEKTASADMAKDGVATVTFENERKNIYWLDGNAYVDNVFGKAS